jgi:hypothetical protein
MDSVVIAKQPTYGTVENGGYDCEEYRLTFFSHSQDSISPFSSRLTTARETPNTVFIHDFSLDMSYHNGAIRENINRLIFIEKRNNYILDEIIYSNVKIFNFSYKGVELVYYWAKNIGLIREERYLNDSTIYVRNLIRYNVKPYKK